MSKKIVKVIQALPGTKMIFASPDCSTYSVITIVAWSCVINTDSKEDFGSPREVFPITIEGWPDLEWALEHSTGIIETLSFGTFTNTKDWLKALTLHLEKNKCNSDEPLH